MGRDRDTENGLSRSDDGVGHAGGRKAVLKAVSAAPSKTRVRTGKPCSNCRSSKIKCTQIDSESSGCARCRKKHLQCDLALVERELEPLVLSNANVPSPTNVLGLIFPSPNPTSPQGEFLPSHSQDTRSSPYAASPYAYASLPYTRPPPQNTRPRYSGGTPYPDLGLATATATGQHDRFSNGETTTAFGGYPSPYPPPQHWGT
ncbi:hypothetical protein C8F01DRAFT_1143098 [Mycena amicta]|nr:hypothetical protein C8F01DRAFT_1143098 [Mycena amicta]